MLTLYRMHFFCFQMCNRLPEIMKNGEAGIFPVYYSLKEPFFLATFFPLFLPVLMLMCVCTCSAWQAGKESDRLAYDDHSASIIRLSNGTVLYLRQVGRSAGGMQTFRFGFVSVLKAGREGGGGERNQIMR